MCSTCAQTEANGVHTGGQWVNPECLVLPDSEHICNLISQNNLSPPEFLPKE